ncbi:hypothetical protein C4579_04165 [Candidatus Microgenomates bacterium]|nr:MAG: hypothetical protein C4579_04165 [Candidatus Microgenomates bacterium]
MSKLDEQDKATPQWEAVMEVDTTGSTRYRVQIQLSEQEILLGFITQDKSSLTLTIPLVSSRTIFAATNDLLIFQQGQANSKALALGRKRLNDESKEEVLQDLVAEMGITSIDGEQVFRQAFSLSVYSDPTNYLPDFGVVISPSSSSTTPTPAAFAGKLTQILGCQVAPHSS